MRSFGPSFHTHGSEERGGLKGGCKALQSSFGSPSIPGASRLLPLAFPVALERDGPRLGAEAREEGHYHFRSSDAGKPPVGGEAKWGCRLFVVVPEKPSEKREGCRGNRYTFA